MRAEALRAEGFEATFVDTSPESAAWSKPSYCFQLSTDQTIGQMSVWSSGECDFDILDSATKELKPDLWGLSVDDDSIEATFANFCSLVTGR